MEKYSVIIWLILGVIVAVYGFITFKFNKFGLIFWFGKRKVKHKDRFTDYFGKDITFLGGGTAVSAFFFMSDSTYLQVSVLLNSIIFVYFILEAFHLVKLYSKDIDDTQTHTVK